MEDSEAGQAFNRLAGYIFGKNEQNEKMEMTTPVFSNKNQKMQFVVEESSNSIKPVDGSVAVKDPLTISRRRGVLLRHREQRNHGRD